MRKDETPSAMYNELVEAIVKVVPEIVIKRISKCMNALILAAEKYADYKTGNFLKVNRGITRSELSSEIEKALAFGNEKILEYRPITIEDVLRALLTNEAQADDTDYCQMCGLGNLDFVVYTLCRDKWLLGKSLSEQSTETISFLHSLLCKS